MKKISDQYLKIVEWSEEDKCYIGRCPSLMLGGIHGKDDKKVYAELCKAVEEWISIQKKDGDPLPPPTSGKKYSGVFNLRLGKDLHERLALEAMKKGESLNFFCVKSLQKQI